MPKIIVSIDLCVGSFSVGPIDFISWYFAWSEPLSHGKRIIFATEV